MFRNFSDTIGLTESDNHNIGLARNLDESVGVTESFNRLRSQIRNINEIVGAVDTTTKIRGLWKNVTDTIGLQSIENRAEPSLFEFTLEDGSGTLFLEDSTGNYAQEQPVLVVNEIVGVVENQNRLKNIFKNLTDIIGLTEVNEAYNVIKKVVSSIVAIIATSFNF